MCSSCLRSGDAAQPAFGTKAEHSSTCHRHLGARGNEGNEGTLFRPSEFLLTVVQPRLKSRWMWLELQTAHPVMRWPLLKPGCCEEWCLPGFGIKVCTSVSGKQSACRYVTHLILNCCQYWQPLVTYATVNRNLWKSIPVTAKGPKSPSPRSCQSALSFLTPLNSPPPQPCVHWDCSKMLPRAFPEPFYCLPTVADDIPRVTLILAQEAKITILPTPIQVSASK